MQELSGFEQAMIYATLVIALLGLAYAIYLRQQVLSSDKGTPEMQRVWNAIKTGALAYLSQQLRRILPLIAVLTVALFLSVFVVPPSPEAVAHFKSQGVTNPSTVTLIVAIGRAVAFIAGAAFSLSVGQLGMRIAVDANVRVASEARRSFGGAMQLAYRAGTVTGMLTDALGLLGGTIIFIIFGKATPDVLLGYGFGATLLALFMRVGGGIFTKAADVGADLVGKVEQGLEEDDKRNAAVIADLVGDNVGDCAGMAADIFESYEVTIVSGLILGLALVAIDPLHSLQWIVFPLVIRGIGVLSSIIGTFWVKSNGSTGRAALAAINRGFYISASISVLMFGIFSALYMKGSSGGLELRPFLSVTLGVGLAIAIDKLTEYFTDTHFAPVKAIAQATGGGPATAILSGMTVGKESAVWTTLLIAGAVLLTLLIWSGAGVAYVLYGMAMTGVGMLSLTGNNVAMDSFGPISDNANGVAEMAGETAGNCRQVLGDLDAVGNTTKAITKGVAIGSAVIAAVSLFGSYITDVNNVLAASGKQMMNGINIANPNVFVGLLLGGSLPWLFSSIAIKAVERAAGLIVDEVRRQFKNPDIMSYKVEPDYKSAVSISTQAAQRELFTLASISVLGPIITGLLLGVEALGGFLGGVILSGQLLAVYMANAGGAWDNAKKTIEDEPRDMEKNTGKRSDRHKAAVVGDTVGDPLKDTAGPSLNPMIKVINLVSVIIAPLVVGYAGSVVSTLVGLLLIAAFAGAVWMSKRESAAG